MNTKETERTLFFSYGHDAHSTVVFKIKSLLEEEGFKVFLDTERLKSGDIWEEALERAIEENEKFVLFITEYSLRRPNGFCLNEITEAVNLNKEIIPIALEEAKLPLSINRLQYLDFQDVLQTANSENFKKRVHDLIEILNGNKTLEREGLQAKVLTQLNPIDFRQDFKKHQNIVGRKWIIKTVDNWLSEHKENRILWITANAGYGKSALAVYLANHHPDVIGIHFCAFNASHRNDPLSVIKTLAYHFQSQIDGYMEEIKDISTNTNDLYTLVDELILNPLERITQNNKNYIFIIDAIDEAKEKNKNVLAELIRDKLLLLPPNIKIIITSRSESYLKTIFSTFNPLELHAEKNHNRDDCVALIKKKLTQYHAIDQEQTFVDTLLKQSEANMLYINMFFQAVDNGQIKLEDPSAFPSGLSALYNRDFSCIFTSLESYYDDYSPIFETLIIYGDYIQKSLLKAMLHLTTVQLNRRLHTISSFLDKQDESFRINHKSLEDWLQKEHDYQVDLENAQTKLELFLENIDTKTYVNYSKSFMLGYLLVKHEYAKDKTLIRYKDLVKNSDNTLVQIKNTLKVSYMFIEKEELLQAVSLQKIAFELVDTLYDRTKEIELLPYYLEITQLLINNHSHVKNNKFIESSLLKIDKIFSREKPSEKWVQMYANISLEWSKYIMLSEPKKALSYTKKSKKHFDTLSTQDSDFVSNYTTTTTMQSVNLLGPLSAAVAAVGGGVNAIGIGAILGPVGFAVLGGMALLNKKKEPKKAPQQKKSSKQTNFTKAIKLYEENLSHLEVSLDKNPQKWIRPYKTVIDNILPLYKKTNNKKHAKKWVDKGLAVVTHLNAQNPNRWQKLYNEFQNINLK